MTECPKSPGMNCVINSLNTRSSLSQGFDMGSLNGFKDIIVGDTFLGKNSLCIKLARFDITWWPLGLLNLAFEKLCFCNGVDLGIVYLRLHGCSPFLHPVCVRQTISDCQEITPQHVRQPIFNEHVDDATLVSPLTRDGAPHPGADRTAGSAVAAAANRKRRVTYPEQAVACRCKFVVVGIKVGGLFGAEAAAFLRKLAVARAREMPARLRTATRQASLHRWMGQWRQAASGRAFGGCARHLLRAQQPPACPHR